MLVIKDKVNLLSVDDFNCFRADIHSVRGPAAARQHLDADSAEAIPCAHEG